MHYRSTIAGLVSILALAGCAATAQPLRTCECKSQDFGRYFDSADMVFAGIAADIKPNQADDGQSVTFRVEQSWKGNPLPKVQVIIAGPCSGNLMTQKNYLIYANRLPDGRLVMQECGAQALAEFEAAKERRRLDQLTRLPVRPPQ